MPIETSNSNSLPMGTYGVSLQVPVVPSVIGTVPVLKGRPVEGVSAPIQVIGLVPVFPCTPTDCRAGLHTADFVADDAQYTLPVFASTTATDTYHNDRNAWLFQFMGTHNPITLGEFKLQQYAGGAWSTIATLNSTTYGVPYANNFQPNGSTCIGGKYYGYKLYWRNVLSAFGEGTYRFYVYGNYVNTLPYCYASPPFCLKTFDCQDINQTVKFEAQYKGGNFGSVTTQGRKWNLCCATGLTREGAIYYPISWYDSIRFYGYFSNSDYDKQVDSIKYQTGVIAKVRDEVVKKFKLQIGGGGSTRNAPLWLLERFVAYAMSADQLYVSDYNINNPNYNLNHFWVVADGGLKPTYKTSSRYMKVFDTEFKEGQQYVYRDRCC